MTGDLLYPNGDMSDTVKLALRQVIQLHVAVLVVFTWISLAEHAIAEINDQTKLFPEQNEGNTDYCVYVFLILFLCFR